MTIGEFIGNYNNHPVLFIGTGISLRYLQNSFTWDGLLMKIAQDLKDSSEYYYDLKADCEQGGKYNYPKIATKLEQEFNEDLKRNRSGKLRV